MLDPQSGMRIDVLPFFMRIFSEMRCPMLSRRIIFLCFLAILSVNYLTAADSKKQTEEPRYLVVVGYDMGGGIKIFDALTGECVKDLDSLKFIPVRNYTKFSLSADGKHLVVPAGYKHHYESDEYGRYAETVSVIDVKSGQIIRNLGRESGEHGAISPDGKFVVSMYGNKQPEIKLWETETGKLLKKWKHPNGSDSELTPHINIVGVKPVAFSQDGRYVAAHWNGVAGVWEIPSGEAVATLHLGGNSGNICFSPDGKYLGGSRGVWDIKTGECLYHFDTAWWSFDWSPDGKYVVKNSNENRYSIHDARTGEKMKEPSPPGVYGFSVACSPDGKYIAFGQWSDDASIYDVENDKFVSHFGKGNISALAFVPFSAEQMKILEKRREAAELLTQGVDYLKLGQKKMAVDELKKAADADKEAWEADFVLGLVEAFSNNSVANAYAAFQRCEKKTKDAAVVNNFAVTSAIRGKHADALAAWETLAESASPPDAVAQNVGVMMERVNQRKLTSLSAPQKKQLIDLHLKLKKKSPDAYDATHGWRFMPLPGLTDNEECEAFFTRKPVKGKPKEAAYEWRQ